MHGESPPNPTQDSFNGFMQQHLAPLAEASAAAAPPAAAVAAAGGATAAAAAAGLLMGPAWPPAAAFRLYGWARHVVAACAVAVEAGAGAGAQEDVEEAGEEGHGRTARGLLVLAPVLWALPQVRCGLPLPCVTRAAQVDGRKEGPGRRAALCV